MTEELNYSSEDWKNTEKEEFTVDPQTVAELDELMIALHDRCEEANVPFFCAFAFNHNGEAYEISASQVLPIARAPAEMLLMAAMGKEGIGIAQGALNALGITSPLQRLIDSISRGTQG